MLAFGIEVKTISSGTALGNGGQAEKRSRSMVFVIEICSCTTVSTWHTTNNLTGVIWIRDVA
jgi:hypothetical protein